MLKNFWPFRAPAAKAAVPEETPNGGRLCPVFSSYSPIEANIVSGMLEDSGIECVLSNELISAMESPIANATGGVQVLVRASDAAMAADLLREMSQTDASAS